MFTGIVEAQGILRKIEVTGSNKSLWIESSISPELKMDQSVSHNGVCLTVEEIKGGAHRVTAIQETLTKSTIDNWQLQDLINLERCMVINDRIDGHLVQGHVDSPGICIDKIEMSGSWKLRIRFPEAFAQFVIEKGSVCINGVSLTAFDVQKDELSVAIIPYTFHHTNIKSLKVGDPINIEFDMIGKYVQRWQQLQQQTS
ncbi:MAG: riboflavin synthase [Flavitalea sp.]